MYYSHVVSCKKIDGFVVGLHPHHPTSSQAVHYTDNPTDFAEHTEHADHVTVNHRTTHTAYSRTGTQLCCLAELASHTGCELKAQLDEMSSNNFCFSAE